MAITTFNYERFEVFTMPAEQWWRFHKRTELKYHDPEGYFGAEKYDYFLYRNIEEIDRRGSSRPYILIHTRKSLERMRQEIRSKVSASMRGNHEIDINEVVENDLVIIACDMRSGSALGENNASIFFQRKENGV
jgi:hypothetical protein